MSWSLAGLLALPTIALPVARAATGKAPDAAMAGRHQMPGVQAAEASAVNPPPERHSRPVELWTTTASHLLPAHLLARSRRSSGKRPEHLRRETRRYHSRRGRQQGRRSRVLRASSRGCLVPSAGCQRGAQVGIRIGVRAPIPRRARRGRSSGGRGGCGGGWGGHRRGGGGRPEGGLVGAGRHGAAAAAASRVAGAA